MNIRRIVFCSVLILCGCSSALKRAEKLMEGGAYEDAARAYEEILKKTPDEADAQIGLRQARLKLIETRLIEIRMTRLAENQVQATRMLNDLLAKQNSWKLFPSGAVAFTQTEETDFSIRFVDREISQAITNAFPLKAAFLLKTNALIYEKFPPTRQKQFSTQMSQLGQTFCTNEKKKVSVHSPYSSLFIHKYCQFWNQEVAVAVASEKIASDLWKGIRVNSKVSNIEPGLVTQLEALLNEGFRKTAWYEVSSQKLASCSLTGDFTFQRNQKPERMYHQYTVKIPYVSYEPVTKSREVPYQEEERDYDPATQSYHSKWVTKTRSESYVVNEPVTRYRDEPRVFNFMGIHYDQHAKLDISGAILLGVQEVKVVYQKERAESADVHNVSMPDIGLSPRPFTLPERTSWLAVMFKELSESARADLASLWIRTYCDSPSSQPKQKVSEREMVLRCLRQPMDTYPAFTQNWFQSQFGLDVNAANEMIGFLK